MKNWKISGCVTMKRFPVSRERKPGKNEQMAYDKSSFLFLFRQQNPVGDCAEIRGLFVLDQLL